MSRTKLVAAILAALGIAAAVAYQVAARERDYRALVARGDTALHDDQAFAAIEAYSGAIALRPDSVLAHLRRGEAYRRRGELDEAARDFRTAASLDPNATRPLEALGDVLFQMQRFDRAAETYARDLMLDDRSAAVSYKLALARYRLGDVSGAQSTLASTIRLNDRLAEAQYLSGVCDHELHHDTEAIQALERAVALAPALVPAREELADLYIAAGRHGDAVAQLTATAAIDRDHVERQVALGLAQARAGQEEVAVLTLGNALERSSDSPIVYRALGQVWLDRAQGHNNDRVFLEKAIQALATVAGSANATSDVLTLYGRALTLAGQNEAAERTLELAATRYPVDPQALVLYSEAAERQMHIDAARQALIDYTGLTARDDEFVSHATRIATLSIRLNDRETASTWLQRAVDAAPDDARVLEPLAEAQLRAKDTAGARATVERALAKDPTNAVLLKLQQSF